MQKSIKGLLNYCKLLVISKCQNKLCNNFRFKEQVLQILTSGVVYKCQCGLCTESYFRECVRHLAVRSGKHINILPLTNKSVQRRKDSAVCHHLLNCNYSPSFEDFSVLRHENKTYPLELKESLSKVEFRPAMNQNICPITPYLF